MKIHQPNNVVLSIKPCFLKPCNCKDTFLKCRVWGLGSVSLNHANEPIYADLKLKQGSKLQCSLLLQNFLKILVKKCKFRVFPYIITLLQKWKLNIILRCFYCPNYFHKINFAWNENPIWKPAGQEDLLNSPAPQKHSEPSLIARANRQCCLIKPLELQNRKRTEFCLSWSLND